MSEKHSQASAEPKPGGAEAASGADQEELEYQDEVHDVMVEFQPSEQLDSRLAVMEEEFRKSFDERLESQNPKKQLWADESEMMRTSKILREASVGIGDDWPPIFSDLMAKFAPEIVEAEKQNIEKEQPLVQGYKALTIWRDHMGPNYTAKTLVDVLRKHNMDDVADELLNILEGFDAEIKDDKKDDKTGDKKKKKRDDKGKGDDKAKPGKGIQRKKSDAAAKARQGILDNRRLLLLAKKVGENWEPLGKALGVPDEELSEIREGEDGKTYQGAFKVLWAWRQTQPGIETEESRNILKTALEKVGRKGLLEELAKK